MIHINKGKTIDDYQQNMIVKANEIKIQNMDL